MFAVIGIIFILIGILDAVLYNFFSIDIYYFMNLPPLLDQMTAWIAGAIGIVLCKLSSQQEQNDQE